VENKHGIKAGRRCTRRRVKEKRENENLSPVSDWKKENSGICEEYPEEPYLSSMSQHDKPNEKQALLGGGRNKMTPSQEHHLTPHDAVRDSDVKMPPIKADMVNGTLIPTVGHVLVPALRQKTSRVTIEIHTDTGGGDGGEKGGNDMEAVMGGLLRGNSMKHGENEVLHDKEFAVLRIFRRKKKSGGRFGGKEDEGNRIC
jgi:hypothetical protein